MSHPLDIATARTGETGYSRYCICWTTPLEVMADEVDECLKPFFYNDVLQAAEWVVDIVTLGVVLYVRLDAVEDGSADFHGRTGPTLESDDEVRGQDSLSF